MPIIKERCEIVTPKFLDTKNVLIIDAYNLLLRILFSKNKGAVILSEPELIQECAEIFIRQIIMCIKKYSCERLYIGFDNGGSIRKKAIFEAYKQNRPNSGTNYGQVSAISNTNNELFATLKAKVLELCYMLNLPVFHEYGIECDDFVGVATKELNNMGKQVIILSNDSDFLQLCKIPSVICSIPYNKSEVSLDNFTKYFSELPKARGATLSSYEYLFYKVIVGDASDNIPGIKGIGYKTLNKLMKEQIPTETPDNLKMYVSDNLAFIRHLADKNATKLEKLIHDNLDILERNYKLIDLSDTVISPRTVSLTLTKLQEVPEMPDKKELMKKFHATFSGQPNIEFLINTLFSLKPIYRESV